jgi:hypothetical protein
MLEGHFSAFYTLKIEAAGSSKMLVHSITWRHISEDSNIHIRYLQNLKAQILTLFTSQTFIVKEAG